VNGDPVLSATRPEMPYVINIAGFHCHPGQPLPNDILEFVDSSEGFILFSLGSIFDSILTEEQKSIFLTAFSQIKYKVIWKYKDQLANIPKNVKILKWIPQQDVLAHPKAKAFITHAGLLSLQEAFYNNVPTITLPLFGDQPGNAAFLASMNLSIPLQWNTLNVDDVVAAITKAAEDRELRENVQRASKVFKDLPEKPMDKAMYWLEYVMRHKGAPHLQSTARNLNFFQYFLVDVVAFSGMVILTVFSSVYLVYLVVSTWYFLSCPSVGKVKSKKN